MKRSSLLLLPLSLILLVSSLVFADGWRDKVDPWVLDSARAGETEFLVFLDEQADLGFVEEIRGKTQRGTAVFKALTRTADESQGPVLQQLRQRGVEHRPYWIANMIWVRGGQDTVQLMAERTDVRHVYANPRVRLDEPFVESVRGDGSSGRSVEWNIEHINAVDAWAVGVFGDNAVVAGQDTGYLWFHPALVGQYRGGPQGDHAYNWHDSIHSGGGSCGADSPEPCDDHGHGTHTMGTVLGDDGQGNQVGVAPRAQWIGCRNMDQGVGTPATYAECYEFFIAPTDLDDENPDPSKAPHVINNSWGCPPSEGCTDPNVLLTIVQNVRAAGIVTVHSAGNDGSSCSTVSEPAAIYGESFSVGATDSSDDIAYFSSRGPVTVDGSNRLKPDISAPGVNIRSSTRDGGYQGGWDGTSMAGPHVAGLVALLIGADIGLAGEVDEIEQRVELSAFPLTTSQGCGGDGPTDVPNNVFGWGRIDAWQAVVGLEYVIQVDPVHASLCAGDDAMLDVEAVDLAGAGGSAGLVLEELPAGTSGAFSVNPLPIPGTSILTLSNTDVLAPGQYPLTVAATVNGTTRRARAELEVYAGLPGTPQLQSPINGASEVVLAPVLEWLELANAESYTVEVATDTDFLDVVYSAAPTAAVHQMEAALEPLATYFWRVNAGNPCGESVFSETFTFTTRDTPAILLVDDDDNSPDVVDYYSGALDSLGLPYDLWDTGNSDDEPSFAQLAPYSTVIWFTGDEFGGAAGPGSGGESALAAWLDASGRCLLLSSQDYYWDRGLTTFMGSHLGVADAESDESQTTVTGGGSLFDGLGPYSLSYPGSNFSDALVANLDAEIAFDGDQGVAALSVIASAYTTAFLAFPFEAIAQEADRADVLTAFLEGCLPIDSHLFSDGFESGDWLQWSEGPSF